MTLCKLHMCGLVISWPLGLHQIHGKGFQSDTHLASVIQPLHT